jgi:hypothetical protein
MLQMVPFPFITMLPILEVYKVLTPRKCSWSTEREMGIKGKCKPRLTPVEPWAK